MSSTVSAAITSSRRCENGETCVAYAQLGEPAKLSRYNDGETCSACNERRLDAEVAGASEPPREEPRRHDGERHHDSGRAQVPGDGEPSFAEAGLVPPHRPVA
jgi:hypothetical protein